MIRKAEDKDVEALSVFLAQYPDTSMFLRGNLYDHGLNSEHPHGSDYFLWEVGGVLEAVFGITNHGFLMCQMPNPDARAAGGFVHMLENRKVVGITGDAHQVPTVVDALGYPEDRWRRAVDEPHYALELNTLGENPDVGKLHVPQPEHEEMLCDWFYRYELDTGLSTAGPAAQSVARDRAHSAIHSQRVRILVENGQPCAMTAFNAALPDIVQVGGVYVPDALRNRGYARRVVAAHLAVARAEGVSRAVLFAASKAASRAYEAIGFQHIGSYRIQLVAEDASA